MDRLTTGHERYVAALLAVALATTMVATHVHALGIETVVVEPGSFSYRRSGEFLLVGQPVDGALQLTRMARPFVIMKYQVTAGAYEACVEAGACSARLGQGRHLSALPVTGVSFDNASAYARWYSTETGKDWRLPTDEEWAYAAGSRFVDDALSAQTNVGNPARRWLLEYQKAAELGVGRAATLQPSGAFGTNEHGVADLAGNVWEWTASCYYRHRLDADGQTLSTIENCGVRIVEGQHRAYVSTFVQDAKAGGCAVGLPPDNLGFRLVRDLPRRGFGRIRDLLGL
jgi:formylglycine-generating enzyme required for sulfatase activity